MRSFPKPDTPDNSYWEKHVVPRLNKNMADQRALDLSYAAKCEKLEIKERSVGGYHKFYEVRSVHKNGQQISHVSQHRVTGREAANDFKMEAEMLRLISEEKYADS